jgi:hypothetical protein
MPEPTHPDPVLSDDSEPTHGSAASTPRWVKISGIVALVVILLVVVLLLLGGGNHGPGRHVGGDTPPTGVTEGHAAPEGGHGSP